MSAKYLESKSERKVIFSKCFQAKTFFFFLAHLAHLAQMSRDYIMLHLAHVIVVGVRTSAGHKGLRFFFPLTVRLRQDFTVPGLYC